MQNILCISAIFLFSFSSAQVGMNIEEARGALDINVMDPNTKEAINQYGLVLPSNYSSNQITNPHSHTIVVGTIFFDTGDNCMKVFYVDKKTSTQPIWSPCMMVSTATPQGE